jgi:hypothetical protein
MEGFGTIDATLSIWLIPIRNKISAVNLLPRNKWNKHAAVDRPKGRGKGTLPHDPPQPPGRQVQLTGPAGVAASRFPSGRDEKYPPPPSLIWMKSPRPHPHVGIDPSPLHTA